MIMPAVTAQRPMTTSRESGSPSRGTAASAASAGATAVIMVVLTGPNTSTTRVKAHIDTTNAMIPWKNPVAMMVAHDSFARPPVENIQYTGA